MVLQGEGEGFSPPFDASLYKSSLSPGTPASEQEIEYRDCDLLMSFFSTTPEVTDILPEGIVPYSDPPTAAVVITHYPFSTVGEYHEFFTVIQVEDLDGEMAYYIPYIYVTNDAALAAGREAAGAPKKLADIGLDTDGTLVEGWMDRPEGQRLVTMTGKPEQRAEGNMVEHLLGEQMNLLSIRHLPPIEGGDGCTQLIKWYANMDFHEDESGERKRWIAPTNLHYDAETKIDPVHKVSVEREMAGLYGMLDMELGMTEVHKEWEL